MQSFTNDSPLLASSANASPVAQLLKLRLSAKYQQREHFWTLQLHHKTKRPCYEQLLINIYNWYSLSPLFTNGHYNANKCKPQKFNNHDIAHSHSMHNFKHITVNNLVHYIGCVYTQFDIPFYLGTLLFWLCHLLYLHIWKLYCNMLKDPANWSTTFRVLTNVMTTSPYWEKYSCKSFSVSFQGIPKTIKSEHFCAGRLLLVLWLSSSSIFRLLS